ncbi:hypothetical protein ACQY0O_006858 [Thecaphora frezii]
MASLTLDYGSASDAAPDAAQLDAPMMVEDDAMDGAGAGAEAGEAKVSSFYPLPREVSIDSGAQRGPSPLSKEEQMALDDPQLLGQEEPSEAPSPPPVEGGSDIRLDTVLIEGLPITQMSTSRLFAYVTHYGAQPLGLEWVDDQRCNIVFPTEESARLALEYLCPATDMSLEPLIPLPNLQAILAMPDEEWDTDVISSLVAPRRAHRVPTKLYTAIERQTAKMHFGDLQNGSAGASTLPEDVPEIYREMEEADRRQRLKQPEFVALTKLRSSLYVRHAVRGFDVKPSRAASKSQWYREHGQEAGKEIVPRLLDVGDVGEEGESVELFPDSQKREFGSASLPPRPQGGMAASTSTSTSDARRGRGAADRRAVMDELDSELDAHIATRNNDNILYEQKLEGQMMADLIEGKGAQRGDLTDRLGGSRGDGGRASGSSAQRWDHDDFERQEARPARRGGGRERRGGRGGDDNRAARDALDDDLNDIQDARERRRSASPLPRAQTEGGRIKMKGRGAMKAPAISRGWGGAEGGDDDDKSWAMYGTERYGQARRDRHRGRSGGGGGEGHRASGDLASRLDGGAAEGRDLLSRLDDSGRQRSLAERFG